MRVLGHFDTESYTWGLDTVLLIWYFETFCHKNIFKKYLKQFSIQRLDIVQNVLLPSRQKLSQWAKCPNAPKVVYF